MSWISGASEKSPTEYAMLDREQWRAIVAVFDGDDSRRDEALDTLTACAPQRWVDDDPVTEGGDEAGRRLVRDPDRPGRVQS